MPEKACKDCSAIFSGSICPECKSTNMSEDWSGLILIFDLERSEIAKKLDIKKNGRYAVRVR